MIFAEDWREGLDELVAILAHTFKYLSGKGICKRILFIVDDMTNAINDGSLNLRDVLTEGRHWKTDVFVVYHGMITSGRQGPILRNNVQCVLGFGRTLIHKLADRPEVRFWSAICSLKPVLTTIHSSLVGGSLPQGGGPDVDAELC